MNDNKKMDELLQKIDNIPLISDDELENMDFYELSYYMQTLNQIDSLGIEDESVGEE